MKKAFFITIMSALLICSCQKENEEVYSCNKHLNEWAHENLQSIRSMDRDAWLNLDEEYKRPAFNALTPEQKLLFWKDKLKEVMTSFRMERTGKTTSHENVPVFGRTSGHL